jgi:DNA processing protein
VSARVPDGRAAGANADGACPSCIRRCWLLSALSAALDCCARDRDRLQALLGLTDERLIAAVGGRRKARLLDEHRTFAPSRLRRGRDVQRICRHRGGFPQALSAEAAPHMLNVAESAERLRSLAAGPMVAIVGSRGASDYGMAMAHGLARELAASGVAVTSGLADGIARAAHEGALEGQGETVAVLGGGLGRCAASRRALLERVTRAGCAVSELPCECDGRRWGALAAERTLVGLAALTIVVEAEDTPEDLAAARIASALGRTVAAIPGRVTSPLSHGTNALLMDGAHLVRGAADALELLFAAHVDQGAVRREARSRAPVHAQGREEPPRALEPRLRRILERVGAGSDTPQKLTSKGIDVADALLALSELELMGLLSRGDGGRYVPCRPWHQRVDK